MASQVKKTPKPPRASKSDYKKAFDLLDKDKDGFISTSELKEAMASIGLDPTESQLKQMIDSVDSDGKGELNFAEFESLVTREVTQSSLSFARKYFEMYDTDKDGTITVDELYQSLHAAGYSDEHIEDATRELLETADFDKDKKVSFEEYLLSTLFKSQ